jgi:peptidoglycan/LPS O-acetylase OafA/YrhL
MTPQGRGVRGGEMKKLDSLQNGRAFAALSVLLFHTDITSALPKYAGHEIASIFNRGYSGVDYFFVLRASPEKS